MSAAGEDLCFGQGYLHGAGEMQASLPVAVASLLLIGVWCCCWIVVRCSWRFRV